MIRPFLRLALALAVGVGLLLAISCGPPEPEPAPAPAPQPITPDPSPCPGPGPCPKPNRPKPKPGPWGADTAAAVAAENKPCVRTDNLTPDGGEIQIDLPTERHVRNVGGSDGAGLCVFASARHSGDWANEPVWFGLFEWMQKHSGGGTPSKFDKMVQQYAAEKGLKIPPYLQIEACDMEALKAATRNGFTPGVTFSYSPTGRYRGQHIHHMVTLLHCDDRWCGILDNNYPGTVEWMDPETFKKVWVDGGRYWAIIPLTDGLPPAPRNAMRTWTVALAPDQAEEIPGYSWRRQADRDPDLRQLWYLDRLVGSYRLSTDRFHPWDHAKGRWTDPCPPPVACPDRCNYGVYPEEISKAPRYSLSGRECSVYEALRQLMPAGKEIPESSKKARVVVFVEPGKKTWGAASILQQMTEQERAAVIVQEYAPDRWNVGYQGFRVSSTPSAYFLAADGTELYRQEGFGQGAAAFWAEARRKRPDYDPNKNPNGGGYRVSWLKQVSPSNVAVAMCGALLVLAFSRRS